MGTLFISRLFKELLGGVKIKTALYKKWLVILANRFKNYNRLYLEYRLVTRGGEMGNLVDFFNVKDPPSFTNSGRRKWTGIKN